MQFLFLMITILVMSSQSVCIKQYNITSKTPNPFLFAAVSSLFAIVITWLPLGLRFEYSIEVLPYSLGFGIMYVFAIAGMNLAISCGPLALSSLLISFSLLIPTVYGIIFLKDPVRLTGCLGIVLLLVSLILINMQKEEYKICFKWCIFVLMAFCGDGITSTILKMQTLHFKGQYQNEFMIVGIGIAFVIMTILAFRKGAMNEMKGCCKYASLSGVANGIGNMLLMFMTTLIPNAVLFPSLSAGSQIFLLFISLTVYREKISKRQMVGYMFGILSIVLLNI